MASSTYSKFSNTHILIAFVGTIVFHVVTIAFMLFQTPSIKIEKNKKPIPIKVNFVQNKTKSTEQKEPEAVKKPDIVQPIKKTIVKPKPVKKIVPIKKVIVKKPIVKPKSTPIKPKPDVKKDKPKKKIVATQQTSQKTQRVIEEDLQQKQLELEKQVKQELLEKELLEKKRIEQERLAEEKRIEEELQAKAHKIAQDKAKKEAALIISKQQGSKRITAKYKNEVHAKYPKKELNRGGRSGSVKLFFVIGTDGKAKDIRAVSSTSKAFKNAAVKAIEDSTFNVTTVDGKATEQESTQTIDFTTE